MKQAWVYLSVVPGKVIQTLAWAEMDNPLELADEVDKINGDAASTLKMLDPEQNSKFFH